MSRYKLRTDLLRRFKTLRKSDQLRPILLLAPVILLAILGFSIARGRVVNSISAGPAKIVLTEDGFVPSEIEIEVGQTVTFTTNRGKLFWPASDIHPTHEIYPEFDPKNPVKPTELWGFKFDRVGSWRYHDHLAPYYTGTIKVKNPTSKGSSVEKLSLQCSVNKGAPPIDCWNDIIEATIKAQGVNGAFSLMTSLYNKDPSFAENCHTFAHAIGYALYDDYIKTGQLNFKATTATTYCGYGFFHGFMTKLFGSGKDIKLARDFCRTIDAQLRLLAPDSGGSCYHGIGHGSVVDPDKSLWGDPNGLVTATVKMCRDLKTDNDNELTNCYNGAFNGLGTLYTNNQYEFKQDSVKDDPYALCRRQADDLKNSCYLGMYIVALFSANGDLARSARIVETIPEDRYAKTAMVQLASNIAYKDTSDYLHTPFFTQCRATSQRLQEPCLKGGIKAMFNTATPGQEYKRLDLCQSTQILSSERHFCYQYAFEALKAIYSKARIDELCLSLDEGYRSSCQ